MQRSYWMLISPKTGLTNASPPFNVQFSAAKPDLARVPGRAIELTITVPDDFFECETFELDLGNLPDKVSDAVADLNAIIHATGEQP